MAKHNKKRNVGIIYELLLRHISSGVVDDNSNVSSSSMDILKKHFRSNTQLYKEFRLFNALVKTTASSEKVASTILSEARSMALSIDYDTLRHEKTKLIHSINHGLSKDEFYKQWIPEYRMYATIQTLLNDWRKPSAQNIGRMAEYENQVIDWLLTEKKEPELSEQKDPNADKLIIKIMSEKLSKKYSSILNESQKEILSSYVMFKDQNDIKGLRTYLEDLREDTIKELDVYLMKENNAILNSKAKTVKSDVKSISTESITDDTIAKFLTIAKLKSTLQEGE
tara:strand:+ start:1128 stop:1973 length:846 start_codon:yes stop_codon:yes gene_type:complete